MGSEGFASVQMVHVVGFRAVASVVVFFFNVWVFVWVGFSKMKKKLGFKGFQEA